MKAESFEETLSLTHVFVLLRRNFLLIVLSVLLSMSIGFLATHFLPQKYKAKAILSIQSSYFQHPLVSDVMSEIQDPSEMSARRVSLLRLSLSDEFLDSLGYKYQIYQSTQSEPQRLLEREELLRRIEYFSVSPSSFQISIVTNEANKSFSATKELLTQMTNTLIEERYRSLMQARQAILTQATLLNSTLVDTATSPYREDLAQRLATMEHNLRALRARYTENHPAVLKMRDSTQSLKSRIGSKPAKSYVATDEYTKVFLSPTSRATTQEIYDDLLKKLSHLNIVLAMERDRENVSYLGVIEQPILPIRAYFPDPLQFALFGGLAGMTLSGIFIAFSELKRSGKLSPEQAADFMGLELLAEIPALARRDLRLLLDSPKKKLLALPSISAEEKKCRV